MPRTKDTTDRAPTFEEICEHAARVREKIEREWPEWKKALSVPRRVKLEPVVLPIPRRR